MHCARVKSCFSATSFAYRCYITRLLIRVRFQYHRFHPVIRIDLHISYLLGVLSELPCFPDGRHSFFPSQVERRRAPVQLFWSAWLLISIHIFWIEYTEFLTTLVRHFRLHDHILIADVQINHLFFNFIFLFFLTFSLLVLLTILPLLTIPHLRLRCSMKTLVSLRL